MSENSELWSKVDEKSIREKLKDYLNRHSVVYDNDETTEELRQKYINTECGNFIKI